MKNLWFFLVLVAGVALILWGCGNQPETSSNGTEEVAQSTKEATLEEPGHEEHDNDDQAHEGHAHEGAVLDLGEKAINGLMVKATQTGEIKANQEEAVFGVEVTGEGDVIAVRMMVTSAEGQTSLKAKAFTDGGGKFHGHVDEFPENLGHGSKLTVELEIEGGEIVSDDFELHLH